MMANGFPPELTSARLNYELATELARRGHTVGVVTVLPRVRYISKNEGYRGIFFHEQPLNNRTTILRVGPRMDISENILGRGLQYLLHPMWLLLGALRSPKPDVVLCESPPLPAGIAAYLASRIKRAPFVLRIQDIHPDVLVETGLLKNKVLIALLRLLERFIYRKTALITTISPAYRMRIVSKGTQPNKVKFVPNWADIALQPVADFRSEFGLEDVFLITYAGTMSWFQDLETVLVAARNLESNNGIQFLLMGDGPIKENLLRKARELSLKNVRFLPFQPREKYLGSIISSDACIVPLKKSVTTPEMPSKMLEIMMAGTPILANVPITSDIARVVRDAKCGIVIEPENPEALTQGVLWLFRKRHELRAMGHLGRDYALTKFSLKSSVDALENLVSSIVFS